MIDLIFSAFLLWHVSSVITWIGSTFYYVVFVSPSMQKMTTRAREIRLHSFFPRFSSIICGASISALIAGTMLLGYVTSVNTTLDPTGWRLVFISIGAVFGLVGGFLTLGVMLPMRAKIIKIGIPPDSSNNHVSHSGQEKQDPVATIRSVTTALAFLLSFIVVMMLLGVVF